MRLELLLPPEVLKSYCKVILIKEGEIKDFKNGVAYFANELGLDIVPAYIEGAYELMPKGIFFPKRGKLVVSFGPPQVINITSVNKESSLMHCYKQITNDLKSNILHLKIQEH